MYTYTLPGIPMPFSRLRMGRHRGWDASKQIEFTARNTLAIQSESHSKFIQPIRIEAFFYFSDLPNPYTPHKKRVGGYSAGPSLVDLIRFVEEMGTGILWDDPKIIISLDAHKLFGKSESTTINIMVVL